LQFAKAWGLPAIAGLAICAAMPARPAAAQSVAEFYSHTPLTIIVGSGAGGGYDVYARVFAQHYAAHIPGHPVIVVKDQPGAGGLANFNYMYRTAPRDGSEIAASTNTGTLLPLLGDTGAQFDARQFNWIGSIGKQQAVCTTWHTVPVKTIEDARKQQVLVSATSQNATPAVLPRILNALFDTKFKVISGYSTSEMHLALEKGEVQGICGLAWQTLQSSAPAWIANNDLNVLVQMGLVKDKDLPDVPLALDMMSKPEDRAFFRLTVLTGEFGRPFVAPPGVPADRIAVLRAALVETVKDPAFLADAAKASMPIDPLDGEQIQALLNEAYSAPQAVRDRVAKYFLPEH
jgi:tripartite-type tricarboxylate transporter receptor subunit TctC